MMTAPAWAQRTGDHIVPAIETVCDGDPFSFGLCNSYCESKDCDSETPLGTPRACANTLKNYMKKSGGLAPPCESSCPCSFDVETDFATLVTVGNAEFAPPEIDVEGTYEEDCGAYGPDGEDAFFAEASQPIEPLDTSGVVRLFYWVDLEGATCNEVGVGLDGDVGEAISPDSSDYEFIERKISMTPSEVPNCRLAFQKLCPAP